MATTSESGSSGPRSATVPEADGEASLHWSLPCDGGLRIAFHRLLRAQQVPLLSTPDLAIRFLIVASGRQSVHLLDRTSQTLHAAHRLRPGQVLATDAAHVVVGADERIGPLSFWLITLSNADRNAARQRRSGDRLRAMLGALGTRRFACSNELLARLHNVRDAAPAEPEIEALARETGMHAVLVQLLRDAHAPARADTDPALSRAFRAAVRRLDADLSEPPAWEALAGSVGCAAERLWQYFKAETGLTPAEYLNVRRVRRARRLLRAGDRTHTQLAHELGFSTSQYFAVVFRRLTGLTPSEYAQRVRERT